MIFAQDRPWRRVSQRPLLWTATCYGYIRATLQRSHDVAMTFYTPVFRRDVLWYGDVRPSVRPGLRPPVFRTFLLHALTYRAEILHMTLFYCATDQVRVSSLCIIFWRSYVSLWTYNIGYVQFSTLFSYMLWHIELKFCIKLCFTVLQINFECRQFTSIIVGVMPLVELRILEIHSFPHFSLTCFDILNWKFAYDFVSQYYRSSSSVVNLYQLL